jgi:hypothetical protein
MSVYCSFGQLLQARAVKSQGVSFLSDIFPPVLISVFYARAFEHILETDRNAYGDSSTYTLSGASDVFQNSVDDMIAGTH